jgi:hypothetical protein
MNASITVTVNTLNDRYPVATATFSGTQISRHWKDPFFTKALLEAITLAGVDKDIYDFTNFIFSQVNNVSRRRYKGQEVQLQSVTVEREGLKVTSWQ